MINVASVKNIPEKIFLFHLSWNSLVCPFSVVFRGKCEILRAFNLSTIKAVFPEHLYMKLKTWEYDFGIFGVLKKLRTILLAVFRYHSENAKHKLDIYLSANESISSRRVYQSNWFQTFGPNYWSGTVIL